MNKENISTGPGSLSSEIIDVAAVTTVSCEHPFGMHHAHRNVECANIHLKFLPWNFRVAWTTIAKTLPCCASIHQQALCRSLKVECTAETKILSVRAGICRKDIALHIRF